MKIFIVTRGYPSVGSPLLGVFEFEQAKALQRRGFDVVYLALDLRSFRRKRKLGYRSFVKDGIQIEEMSLPLGIVPRSILMSAGRISFDMLMKRAVRKHGAPDVVHAHFLDISESIYSCNMYGAKFVITEHSSQLNRVIDDAYASKLKKVYESADVLISVSESLKSRIYSLTGIDSVCINNMIDTSQFAYADKETHECFTFMTVSALKPHKRIDMMIDSFYELVTRYGASNAMLNIVGEGPDRAKLEAKVKDMSLEKQVIFYGLQTKEKINELLHESDCFILTSKNETFGVACAEAIASGTPVLITKCGGPQEFITAENGFVVEDDEIACGMMHMMDLCGSFDMKSASCKIKNIFGEDYIASKLESVYREI